MMGDELEEDEELDGEVMNAQRIGGEDGEDEDDMDSQGDDDDNDDGFVDAEDDEEDTENAVAKQQLSSEQEE